MRIGEAFPSKWIKASDLAGKVITLIIRDIQMEDIGEDGERPVLYFTKAEKGLVLNRTNAETITTNLGTDDTDQWVGKAITLFPQQVDFRGRQVEAVRIKIGRGQPTKPAPKPPPPEPEPDESIPDDVPF